MVSSSRRAGTGRAKSSRRGVPLESMTALFRQRGTPSEVIEHSIIVAKIAKGIASQIARKKSKIGGLKLESTPSQIYSAGWLHDFVKTKAGYDENHASHAGKLLRRRHGEIATIVGSHGYTNLLRKNLTLAEKIMIYCDLRVSGNKIVSLEERFINRSIK